MRIETVWRGKFPSYWDITPWVALVGGTVLIVSREENTRIRVLETHEIESGDRTKELTIFNVILGTHRSSVYLGRITDARSHVQITRLSNYDIMSRSVKWTLSEDFLVEKFKFQEVTEFNIDQYALGNKEVDLLTGEISRHSSKTNGWEIGNEMKLMQRGTSLVCSNEQQKLIWTKQGYLGSWYQGVKDSALYFLLPNHRLVMVNKFNGESEMTICLDELRVITNRVKGSFDLANYVSFDSTTLADVLITDQIVCWFTNENKLVVHDMKSEQRVVMDLDTKNDLCLIGICDEHLLLIEVEDGMNGSLKIVKWRNGVNGAACE